ncbi:MAG: hypothetical protein IKP27_08265 [Paludibacteraceae bacterium]|nr:hypothetical protein [Paludibacteraceae bacterium]
MQRLSRQTISAIQLKNVKPSPAKEIFHAEKARNEKITLSLRRYGVTIELGKPINQKRRESGILTKQAPNWQQILIR